MTDTDAKRALQIVALSSARIEILAGCDCQNPQVQIYPRNQFSAKVHALASTTQPYDCRRDEVSLDEAERILIPPFGGSNPPTPASQCGLCGVISRCGRTADIPEG